MNFIHSSLAAFGLLAALPALAADATTETWSIPDKVGRAGMVAASLPNFPVIVMAGGANFPYAEPGATTAAQRGPKVFHDDIALMLAPGLSNNGQPQPKNRGRLPEPIGYAAFAASAQGLVIAGGCNDKGHTARAYCVNFDNGPEASELPPLPVSTAYPAFAQLGNMLLVMGGQEKADSVTCLARCFALDLDKPQAGWREIAPLPQGLMLAGAGVLDGKVYVAGGCSLHPDAKGQAERTYLSTTYCYDPATNRWSEAAPMPETIVGAANPLPAVGGKLLVLGGDPGNYYRASLKGEAPAVHPGQSRKVYAFDGKAWSEEKATLPVGIATAPAVADGPRVLIISGETHPGVRTPAITTPSTDTKQ